MKKILVITDNNPNKAARPFRLLTLLSSINEYETHLLSNTPFDDDKIKHFKLSKKMTNWEGFIYILNLYKIFKKYLCLNPIKPQMLNELKKNNYDLIICENLTIVYLSFLIKSNKTKLMLDLREFYINQYSNDFHSHFFKKFYYDSKINYLNYLIINYVSKFDKLITVSPGLQDNYKSTFNLDTDLIMSLPDYSENKSQQLQTTDKIKLVHHGGAKESRKIELMIELMNNLDDRFELDLYLIKYHSSYYEHLINLAKQNGRINIFKEIELEKINNTLVNYDIGLIMFEPTTFNLEYSLPNKLFEFIQSGLAVISYPLPNIKNIIETHNVGFVSQDYELTSIANKLNSLTIDEINKYKLNSVSASKELNSETNNNKLKSIINKLLK